MTEVKQEKELMILDNIPFVPDVPGILRRLYFHISSLCLEEILSGLLAQTVPLARPKAVYKAAHIKGKGRDYVDIDGVRFESFLLRVNLDKAEMIFPYVATSGREIDSWPVPDGDTVTRYCLEVIQESALEASVGYLQGHLARRYGLDYLWSLNTGDFQAWPDNQRRPLFSLLGNVEDLIGVKLRENNSLAPVYSRAGLFYYAETEFEACQLCSREPCMGRRAPFNEELSKKRHLKVSSSCSRLK